ncbi:MAG TPA: tRNA (guanosine(46)-N7)-methyltransferase TrmB [Caulobacteraceae bacterium]|jgi:tRNA (guanine-N7-)-methyltransferase
MAERLGELTLDLSNGRIDPRALAPEARMVWVEIGFGGGEHLAAQGERNPQVLLLGAEPFVNGQASLLTQVEAKRLGNVRIHPGDARELLAVLSDGSVERLFILFPDPWPKARHHKRRLIQAETVAEFARVLAPGGRLRFATDWRDYADWTLERVLRSSLFDWPAERADDWRLPALDHVTTRYEAKRLGDCAPVFFDFLRRS